jgi:aconitate hydratase
VAHTVLKEVDDVIELIKAPVLYSGGKFFEARERDMCPEARDKTIAARAIKPHDISRDPGCLRIKFDALISHDITYVGIIQAARAGGMARFALPYVLTNCHNSLCAVGGTVNEDDHAFGLSAAKKYGGVYVPAHMAVIHQYAREMMAKTGGMILGSDSHTRYGALGCMGVGEGGPELVKQLLGQTWDAPRPDVVAVELTGAPPAGVGPQDVALAIIAAVFKGGFVKNKALEFTGPGLSALNPDFRMGIDVMTTETACLSSVWETDDIISEYYALHGRPGDFMRVSPGEGAVYAGLVRVRLDKIRPMIALPFHPGNALPIDEFLDDPLPRLKEAEELASDSMKIQAPSLIAKVRRGGVYADQGVIAGCAGGMYENIAIAGDMLRGKSMSGFPLSIYPSSQPVLSALMKGGALNDLIAAGAVLRSAFCGPCFGAGDVPRSGALSIRHTTRNFMSREGSKPGEGQMAYVALMDARSIAATALNGGRITPAAGVNGEPRPRKYAFDASCYAHSVYDGRARPLPDEPLVFGPNIAGWPEMGALPENLLLTVASAILDPVTTTDELIPSGETSSYRSNPEKLAGFTLSRRDPGYVKRARAVRDFERERRGHTDPAQLSEGLRAVYGTARLNPHEAFLETGLGTAVFAFMPGDGSAREQAASCQRVLGGLANIAGDYATKRYRSNLINWGLLPLIWEGAGEAPLEVGDVIYIPGARRAVESGAELIPAVLTRGGVASEIIFKLPRITAAEREILLAGCLINRYRSK